jgi:prepilin-type N-terminal cleavage/methylation domain-containing protein
MNRRGFTLVELIMVIAAGSAVALTIWVLFGPVNNWVFTQQRRSGYGEATVAVTRILKEIRRVKAPGQIQTWDADHFQFVDVDNNTVDFQLSGTDLLRDSDVLARNVSSLAFSYLDKDGAVAGAKGQIRVIKVEVILTSGVQTVRLESAARIRNL